MRSGFRTDPLLLEILRNRFKAVAEEMAAATLRTAYTVFVKETHDFGACLLSAKGEVFAAPTDTVVSIMAGLPGWEVVNALGDYEEGDVDIANDPDLTRGLSTHLADIWLWKPIFAEGQIVAFALSFIHSSDVGGKVAGSISPTGYEIFQEGLRIPPMKLYRAGVANQEMIDLVLLNSRIPEQNWGDIRSQLASLNIAERRLKELFARYGAATIEAGIEDVMDQTERRARSLIEEIPDGDYEFVDYMEGDDAGVGLIRVWDPATGARKVEVAQPLNGGSGGRPRQDGIDGTSFTGGWLRNIPNEVLETDMPVVVEEYGYRPGASGGGEYRGGAGIRFRLRSMAPEMLMTARGLERFTFRPWGMAGGMPGQVGKVLLNPGTPAERSLGKLDFLNLEAGDVVQFETASGGGFGDPWQRSADSVVADVEAGFLTVAEAAELYGVAIRNGAVDETSTEALRCRAQAPRPRFDFGPERLAYETVHSDEVASEIIRLLEPFPTRLRPVLRGRLQSRLHMRSTAPTPDELADLLDGVGRDLGLEPRPAMVGVGR